MKTRRKLLSMAGAASGLLAANSWRSPVVESVALPAHAQTTGDSRLFIRNLRSEDPSVTCNGSGTVFFTLFYSFFSDAGVVSHVVTTPNGCGDDTVDILGGNDAFGVGDNLLGSLGNSFDYVSGDEFAGSIIMGSNLLTGPTPVDCLLRLTLTDAEGNSVSADLNLSFCN